MVSTLFGDVVSVIGAPVGVEPHFAGTGELFLCADFNGIFTWELYGPTTQCLTWSDLERSLGRATCGLSQ